MDQEKSRKMNIPLQTKRVPELTQAWLAVQGHVSLRPIRNEQDFVRLQDSANSLADIVGEDVEHPLYSLFELAMELISSWEREHIHLPKAEPQEVLRFLLEANNLRQKDLEDIASPTLVSDILAGRRQISKRLAKALAEKFQVNIGAFI
jgi:HTH-type transcriptional regulator/antitoxin HigA